MFFILKFFKDLFAQEHMECLGHIISSRGITPDHSKIKAMLRVACYVSY